MPRLSDCWLRIEIEAGTAVIVQELDLDTVAGNNMLSLGLSQSYTMKTVVPDFSTKVGTLGFYTLKVYDSYQGHKKLLASRQQYGFQLYY